MRKLLVVVDMQNDFVTGALANEAAQKIVPKIKKYIDNFDGRVVFTQDTHYEDYLNTEEGKKLPVEHCIVDTEGWEIVKELHYPGTLKFKKFTFGSTELGEFICDYYQTTSEEKSEIYFCGTCTDICVISNVLLTKAYVPDNRIIVLEDLCAGITPESHKTALEAMKACQVDIETAFAEDDNKEQEIKDLEYLDFKV